jgi:large exoprotein involved in heme utilization and adhesion
VMFGKNAQLNLAGSFHASTADYLKLGTDGVFYANPALGSNVLTMSPPSAFGFLSAPPGSAGCPNACIEVQSAAGDGLKVVNDQTLSLVGGPIIIGDTSGAAPGYLLGLDAGQTQVAGRINLVSVAAAGEAPFDGKNIDADGFAQLGDVTIQGKSIIDAREIYIRGGQLTINNGVLFPGANPVIFNKYTQPNGGQVNIKATGDLTIRGSTVISGPGGTFLMGIHTQAGLPTAIVNTDAADITIEADSVSISGRATVRSERYGPGSAADIAVTAHSPTNSLTISSGGTLNVTNAYAGSGGSITVNAPDVVLSGVRRLFTGIAGQTVIHPGWGGGGFSTNPSLTNADGATITINAPGGLTVKNQSEISNESRSLGRSADIVINAGNLSLSDGGVIAAQSVIAGDAADVRVTVAGQINIDSGSRISGTTLGSGKAGVVAVSAGQSINLSGEGSGIFGSTNPVPNAELDAFATQVLGRTATFADLIADLGLDPATADIFDVLDVLNARDWTSVTDLSPGDAGKVSVTTPLLSLDTGAVLSAVTLWDGNAGEIEANVDNLSLQGGAEIRSRSGDIRADNGQVSIGTGNAGDVSLNATDMILISDTGSIVSTTTFGDGNAGSISLNANQVNVQSGGKVTSESGGTLAGQSFVGTGNAGVVDVASAGSISVSGGEISTTTFGDGNAGDVSLSADQVNVQGGGSVTSESGGTLNGEPFGGTGNAGIVTITATGPNTLTISGAGSKVSTTTNGAGDGGSISLSSVGNVQILSGGSLSADSLSTDLDAGNTGDITITAGNSITLSNGSISTQAVQADGGNIKVTAPNIVQSTGSEITTSIFKDGGGNGGNINIDPRAVFLNNSKVIANAFTGSGGNIQITADNFIQSASSVVDASSQFGVQGTIVVESPENDIAGSLAQLPTNIVDVSGLLPERCAARHAGGPQSSFVLAGRGGLPTNPDNYLPSFGAGSGSVKGDGMTTSGMSLSELRYINDTTVAMAGWGCLR